VTTNRTEKKHENTHALSDSDGNDENYRALGWYIEDREKRNKSEKVYGMMKIEVLHVQINKTSALFYLIQCSLSISITSIY
jgi:hypothetical protein